MSKQTKAIKSGIVKWTKIKNSKLNLGAGMQYCDLCDLHHLIGPPSCPQCPLAKIGRGCLPEDSNWHKYHDLVIEGFMDNCKLNQIEPIRTPVGLASKLEAHIDQMIIDLQAALKWATENEDIIECQLK